MAAIQNIQPLQPVDPHQSGKAHSKKPQERPTQNNEKPSATYTKGDSTPTEKTTYTADLDKVHAMKEETDRRMIDLFRDSIQNGVIKQAGGYRAVLDQLLKGNSVEGIELKFTQADLEQAQADVAPGGYWSPEATSDRFIEFAIALSGGDTSKADLLIDAFKEGYKMAEEMWGGSLPDISKQTYDLTIEKFETWKNGN